MNSQVILINNLPFSKWEAIFKNPLTTAAAINRLVHHGVILELNIASYRLETAKQARPSDAAWATVSIAIAATADP
jgi:DNA replication protein DnaC